MDALEWQKVRALLEQVTELPSGRRSAYLDTHCQDSRLREQVEAFLARETVIERFERSHVPSFTSMHRRDVQAASVGEKVGPYRLVSYLGHGGMGVVYLAERVDGDFERQVAIKCLPDELSDVRHRRHFDSERRALARLNHPNIAMLLDGGTTAGGTPYLVMEYVEGQAFDVYCSERGRDLEAKLRLMMKICDGVHHAHQHLIIHRDLKPSNILVTADGVPKVLDFGVAKLLVDRTSPDKRRHEETTLLAVTPRYCSPEQLQGLAVTTVSDVYALGVILFELLTGRSPDGGEDRSLLDYVQRVCHSPCPLPSAVVSDARLARRLAGDLDTIVHKALHGDPERRYSSAEALSKDIERFLDGLPVTARRDTFGYRTRKFVQRHLAVVSVATLSIVTLIGATLFTANALIDARRAHERASAERAAAEEISAFLGTTLITANPYRLSRRVGIHELLRDASERIEKELRQRPRVEAAARVAVGKAHAGLWQWQEASRQLRRALLLMRGVDEPNELEIAECLSILGRAETFAQNPECVGLQQEGFAIRHRLLGPSHPSVAESMGNLGYAYWYGTPDRASARWTEAASHYQAAIDLYRKQFDRLTLSEKRDLARFTFSFAVMRFVQKRADEADRLFRSALALYEELGGSGDRYMVACMERYGWYLQREGRLDEARQVIERVIAMTPDHVDIESVIKSQWLLGDIVFMQGSANDAWPHLVRALRMECLYREELDRDNESRWAALALGLLREPEEVVTGRGVQEAVQALSMVASVPSHRLAYNTKLIADVAVACRLSNVAVKVREIHASLAAD